MKEKEMYTFEELLDNLKIPISGLCKRADVTEGTIARIRKGFPTRRSTANRLLECLSDLYGRELSLDNVSGLDLENRPPTRKHAIPPVRNETVDIVPTIEVPQISPTMRNLGGQPKSEIPSDLPAGTIKLVDFRETHGIPESNMSRYVNPKKGIDKKNGEYVETTTRPRVSGPGVQHFLTPEQQEKAIALLKKHGKLKERELIAEEGTLWYSKEGN